MKLKYYHIILITFLSLLLNQIFIQYWLAKKNDDAAIINIAGRQRMLSQRINLEYYKIVNENASPDLLKNLFEEWEQKHDDLINGSEIDGIEAIKYAEARQLLAAISPNIQVIKDYLNTDKTISKADLSTINENQARYLKKMDVIVKMLEAKAKDKLTFIRIMEVVMMLVTMLIIFIEIIFFYSPLNREKDKSIEDLRQNNEELEAILNNSNDGILYRDLKTTKILKGNHKILELIGVDSIETLDKTELSQILPEEPIEGISREKYVELYNESLEKDGKFEANLWINNLKGDKIRVQSLTILKKSKNQNPRIISFEKDITKEYLASEAIKQKNIELEKYIESNLYLSKFAALASHDLQAPLRTIVSFTHLMERSANNKLSQEEKEYLAFIKKGGKNLQILVTDLLALSSIENRCIELRKINPRDLLHQICRELTITIAEKEAKITYNSLPEFVIADEIKLRQIFQNLITNGMKFSKEKPIISISGRVIDNGWEFGVSDNGIGIPATQQQQIFKLFSRLHTQSEYAGTGIGLAMVKKLVEQLSGSIRLESTVGKGSTFYFTIQRIEETKVDFTSAIEQTKFSTES